MSNNRALKFILSSILAFVLAVDLTCLTYIGDLYFRGLNTGVLTGAIMNTNYSIELMESLYTGCESLTLPIGLPMEVVHDIFDLEDIKKDVSASVKATIDGEKYEPDTTAIRTKLLANINKYLEEEQLELSEEQQVYLEEYLTLIEDEYVDNIEMVIVVKAMPYWNSFVKIAGLAAMGMIVLAGVIIVAIIMMHRWVHRALRYITYSTIAAFLMSVCLPTVLYVSHFYERLSISPKYFYVAMVYIIDEFLLFSIRFGSFHALISAMLIGAIYLCKKNGYKRSSRTKSRR